MKNSSPVRLNALEGKRILVNAGPTRENIDPVRFISNYSTGKMGVAIADAAAGAGAIVELVLGPVEVKPRNNSIHITYVTSAESMAKACLSIFLSCDIAILAAAVADFTPETISDSKIKKNDGEMIIRLKPTTDIAAEMGKLKRSNQLIIGFALETDNEIENALSKLTRKNMDAIVLNSLKDKGAGFGHDTNRITIIDRYNNIDKFGLKTKEEAALDILSKVVHISEKGKR